MHLAGSAADFTSLAAATAAAPLIVTFVTRMLLHVQATAAVQQSSSAALYTPQLLELGRTVLPACLRHFHSCNQHSAAAAEPEPVPHAAWEEPELSSAQLTPRQVVELLDRFIVGQDAAKKAVANALRNRWRRHKVPSPLREEIHPKNLLMIGPTGCGKTEIARRLAKLANAPFVKVSAWLGRPHGGPAQRLPHSACTLCIKLPPTKLDNPKRLPFPSSPHQHPPLSLMATHRLRPPSSLRWGSTAAMWTRSFGTWWTMQSS